MLRTMINTIPGIIFYIERIELKEKLKLDT